jgi:hypothetical protein
VVCASRASSFPSPCFVAFLDSCVQPPVFDTFWVLSVVLVFLQHETRRHPSWGRTHPAIGTYVSTYSIGIPEDNLSVTLLRNDSWCNQGSRQKVAIRYELTVQGLGYNAFLLSQCEHLDTVMLQY